MDAATLASVDGPARRCLHIPCHDFHITFQKRRCKVIPHGWQAQPMELSYHSGAKTSTATCPCRHTIAYLMITRTIRKSQLVCLCMSTGMFATTIGLHTHKNARWRSVFGYRLQKCQRMKPGTGKESHPNQQPHTNTGPFSR